jgi:hypothetical protein
MTSGPEGFEPSARPGVRANALSARAFSRVRVVDARVAEALLDVLEDAGVAAYVEPSLGEIGVYRDVRAHGAPSDELYVDAARRDVAMAVIDAELPGMLAEIGPADDDETFASIVATFDDDSDPHDFAPWPDSENSTASATDVAGHDDEWYVSHAATRPEPDEDEHFVPPPPPPLPRLSAGKLWGLLMLIGGFVLMAGLPHLGFDPEEAMVIGIVTTAAGAGTLVWWMRDGPSDSDPDDGAVV